MWKKFLNIELTMNISKPFFPATKKEWNMLDSDIRTSESLNIFKSKVLQFIRPKANYMLFYKDHFYKQLLTEIGKKSSKY